MTTSKNKQSGFTIVELLIVIIVIGILAGLVITMFSGIQEKARDTERQTDLQAMHGQLESFFAQKGYYPSLADLNDRATSGFVATNLKGLDKEAFRDPKAVTADSGYRLVAAPAAKAYAYAVTTSTGSSCESDDTTCAKYTLTATLEGLINNSGTYVKTSLNN